MALLSKPLQALVAHRPAALVTTGEPTLITKPGLWVNHGCHRDSNDTPEYFTYLDPNAAATCAKRARYHILPDWTTSFFWNDTGLATDRDQDDHIDDHVISARYPQLGPAFFSWREVYEVASEEHGLHTFNGRELFPDPEVRVAWCVEGFLLAAWLVLQAGVETVEYLPDGKAYRLARDTLDAQLNEFLGEMEALLQAGV